MIVAVPRKANVLFTQGVIAEGRGARFASEQRPIDARLSLLKL
jgi:hypothetical protein